MRNKTALAIQKNMKNEQLLKRQDSRSEERPVTQYEQEEIRT